MKKIIKATIKVVVYHINALCHSIIWIVKQSILFGFTTPIIANKQGKSLAVIGNGPSLKNELERYQRPENEDIAAVNFFTESSYFDILKPNLYVLIDPAFFWKSELEEVEIKKKAMLEKLRNVTWEMSLLVPHCVKKQVEREFAGSNITVESYYSNPYKGWNKIEKILFAKGLFFPHCQNVMVGAVSYGLTKRYSKISLYGADHSWPNDIRVNEKSQLCQINRHFYDDKEPELKPWLLHDGSVMKISMVMECFMLAFKGYDSLKEYADFLNISIVNKTRNSFIDSFIKDVK